MNKIHIKEVIVVEGYHDTEKLRKYYDCQTIETSGTHLGKAVLDRIAHAQKTTGVIIFTDPDSPGNRIRHAINQAVPGCKNAFVDKEHAHTTKKVGIEHADYNTLHEALKNLVTFEEETKPTITMQDMMELGLNGKPESAALRTYVGKKFHIGDGNAKTMCRRINFAHITKQQLLEVIETWQN